MISTKVLVLSVQLSLKTLSDIKGMIPQQPTRPRENTNPSVVMAEGSVGKMMTGLVVSRCR